MRKLLLTFAIFSFAHSVNCQTLFTYGKHVVTTAEFLQAFQKNNSSGVLNENELREYLNLYIPFKLKVQAARDRKLDQLPSLKAELQSFKLQIEDNYLKDTEKVNALLGEAFTRSQKDIHVLYYFAPLTDPNTGDSLQPFVNINKKFLELSNNQIPASVKSNITESDLGYITAFTLPYEFENQIYPLQVGASSKPYKTKKGWHVFKNIGERRALGKMTIAQILIAFPPGNEALQNRAQHKADSIYKALIAGADFSALAKQFSDDRTSFSNGGLLPEFGVSTYSGTFGDKAFALKKDGDLAAPFLTEYGYHIIKRVHAMPVPATEKDETFMQQLKARLMDDNRILEAKKSFIKKIIPKTGFQQETINKNDLWRLTDSSILASRDITAGKLNEKTVLFLFNDKSKVDVAEWIQFLRNSNKMAEASIHEMYQQSFNEFADASILKNYTGRLAFFDQKFKHQMEEFEEGNILFEIMDQEVWGKASLDSVGLLQYYTNHKENYLWGESADAVIFTASNIDAAKKGIEALKNGIDWRILISENPDQLQADSSRYELTQIPVQDISQIKEGMITIPEVNQMDQTAVFANIIKRHNTREPKSFQEARGLVVNDYQSFLESKWIEQLKKQFPTSVNEKAFKNLLK